MLNLWLIRHGETEWNRQHRWQGHEDPPLNDDGRRQARRLGRRLRTHAFDALFTSDLTRCRQTASLALPSEHPIPDARLREVNFGYYEGKAWTDLDEDAQASLRAWWTDPFGLRIRDGESFTDLKTRLDEWRQTLPSEGRIGVFTHGGVIRCLLWQITGPPTENKWTIMLDNTSITRLGLGSTRVSIVAVNDCAHLEAFVGHDEEELREVPAFEEEPSQ